MTSDFGGKGVPDVVEMRTDADTFDRTSENSGSAAKRSLSILIPEDDHYADKNPNFKTPMDAFDS